MFVVSLICWRSSVARKGATKMSYGVEPKYPDVEVQLVGEDGNALAIMGRVATALRRAGVSNEEIEAYYAESTSSDYDNLLRTATRWVQVA
jgi:hypothetical protein